MAVVRISAKLIDKVLSNVDRMFEARILQAHNAVKSFSTSVGKAWYETIVHPEVMELWNKDLVTMSHWIRNANNISVRVAFKDEKSEQISTIVLSCEFEKTMPMHSDFAMYGPKTPKIEANRIPGLEDAIYTERRITSEREELKDKIKELLLTCGSLQQAYKVFPSILELCPVESIEQFNKPVEKRGKTEIALDPTFVTSLTKARMLKDVTGNQSSSS